MSNQREIDFGAVVGETDVSHAASIKQAQQEARMRAAEERAQVMRVEKEKQRIQAAYEKEQKAKADSALKKKKEADEENERLRLELQISLYREQYPGIEIEKTTERTPLTKLREIKKKVEAKNAMEFMPPMLHMVGGMVIKLYEKMVVEMEINPMDHDVRGLRQFYMSTAARQIMLPAWKATIAANPGILVGGNPWYMQVMMGFYMIAEANSQKAKILSGARDAGYGSIPSSIIRDESVLGTGEGDEGRSAPSVFNPPPPPSQARFRAQSEIPVHSQLRDNLLAMANENQGKGKERAM
jgi:hypothetical protein